MRKKFIATMAYMLVLVCLLTSCQGITSISKENTIMTSTPGPTSQSANNQENSVRLKFFEGIELLEFDEFKAYIDQKNFLNRKIEYLILAVKGGKEKTVLANAEHALNDNVFISSAWAPLHLETIQWNEDPYEHATWRLYFQSLNFVSYLMRAYQITGDLKYLSKAEYYFLDWIEKNPLDSESKSDYTWNDHATSNRAKAFVDFLNLYRQTALFKEETFEKICYALYQHGKYLCNDKNYVDSNHGLMQDQALLQIATIFTSFPDSTAWLEHALNRLEISTRVHVTSEGVHREHSPFYHVFVQDMYEDIQYYLSTVGIVDENIDAVISAMHGYVKDIVTPSGHYPLVSDTNLMQNPKAQYNPELPDKVYGNSGVAFFRAQTHETFDNIYMMFVAAYNSVYHKHRDDLSFILTMNDTDYFIDGGHHGYQKTSERILLLSPYAHNTIMLNDRAWTTGDAMVGNPRVEKSYVSDDFSYLRASHTMYDGAKISRSILFIKPELILIHDQIETTNTNYKSAQQNFNIGADIDVIKNSEGNYTFTSKKDGNFVNLNVLKSTDYATKVYSGSQEPYIGWATEIAGTIHPITTLIFDYPLSAVSELFTSISIGSANTVDYLEYDAAKDTYSFSFNKQEYAIAFE